MSIKLPSNWNDVSLSQLDSLLSLPHSEIEITNFINRLAVLTGKNRDEIKKIELQDSYKMIEKLVFLDKLPSEEKVNWLSFKNRVFKLKKVEALNNADFIDLNAIVEGNDPEGTKVAKMMFILFDKVFGRDVHDWSFFMEMPVGKCYGTIVFFCNIVKNYYLRLLESYLGMFQTAPMEKIQEMEKKTKVDIQLQIQKMKTLLKSERNGDGMIF